MTDLNEITAIYCTADNCPTCNFIKGNNNNSLFDKIKKLYTEREVKWITYETPDRNMGIQNPEYYFLGFINYWPTLILIPTYILNISNQLPTEILLNSIMIFSGEVNKSLPFFRLSKGSFNLSDINEYIRFLDIYSSSKEYKNKLIVHEPTITKINFNDESIDIKMKKINKVENYPVSQPSKTFKQIISRNLYKKKQ